MYTLFDPPVNTFSPPEKIAEWLAELRAQASRPEFRDDSENRKSLEDAVAEAERWLAQARGRAERRDAQPPNQPAL
ncbi:MAG: hypothetical protein JO306_02405 [Gemmatimonadetes bacterium]|nr:hypothetical protein [Gemmatimonadota bacterium]